MRLILTTFANSKEAMNISKYLVGGRFAACATFLPVRSIYWWEGKVEGSNEILALFKTRKGKAAILMRELERLHPYDVPEILEIPVTGVSGAYLNWVKNSLRAPSTTRNRAHPSRSSRARQGPIHGGKR